jgi:hypothetical protein
MKKALATMLTMLLMISIPAHPFAGSSDNKLTEQQKAEGWQLLFDGKTLDGWSIKSGFATYQVDQGAIVGTTVAGSPNTFLCSEATFADFELTFEVRFDDQFFNSGIQVRSKLRGEKYGGRVYGPQIEIEKSPGQSGYIYGEAAGGWQSPEPLADEPSSAHNHFRNDGWNQYRIRAVGRRIQTWINGNRVADLVYDEGRYMDNSQGFIGLQVHGIGDRKEEMTVRWKNIYIKSLNALDQKEAGRGATALFNGTDFEGWSFHLGEKGADNNGAMSIREGTVICPGQPRGYLYTDKSYSDYIISYEWAFDRPDDLQVDSLFRGNSGCLVHIGEKNALGIWPRSIEVQGQHRRAGLILPIPRDVKCETTFDLKAYYGAINPVGQWSTMTIDVRGGDMLIRVNGIQVSTVRNSELTSGPIGLQSEGAPIRWKNIKLLER